MENQNAENQTEEVVLPQNIEEMDEEAFDAYIQSAKQEDGEVQAEPNSGEAEPAKDDEENQPYMSFMTKEELQAYQDRTIGNRLKEIREAGVREKEEFARLSQLAKERYRTDNDMEAMTRLMEELNPNPPQTNISALHEIQRLRDEMNYQKQVEGIQTDWIRQGEALKKIVPDFDLESAFENPEFYRLVVEDHQSLAEAYPALQKKTGRRTISEIGNATNGVTGHINHDVKSMSDHEFDDYIKRIKNI